MEIRPLNALGIKSLLGTEFLTYEQIRKVIDFAFHLKELAKNGHPYPKTLNGKTVILLFFEPSTRTRSSFELAANRLGANTTTFTKESSSTEKGETLYDTAKTLQAMQPDIIVLRHPSAGSPHHLDQILQVPIVNAGDGFHEHPTQALLDIMTIEEFKVSLRDLKVLIVGDIAHSRVARSDIYAMKSMGAQLSVCGPPTLIPPHLDRLGVHIYYDLEEAVKDQDVIIVLRIQIERLNPGQNPSKSEYAHFYGVSDKVLKRCKPDVLIMHPGPVNRGVELAPEVADGPNSVILDQVANGVLVRMALLHILTGGEVTE